MRNWNQCTYDAATQSSGVEFEAEDREFNDSVYLELIRIIKRDNATLLQDDNSISSKLVLTAGPPCQSQSMYGSATNGEPEESEEQRECEICHERKGTRTHYENILSQKCYDVVRDREGDPHGEEDAEGTKRAWYL